MQLMMQLMMMEEEELDITKSYWYRYSLFRRPDRCFVHLIQKKEVQPYLGWTEDWSIFQKSWTDFLKEDFAFWKGKFLDILHMRSADVCTGDIVILTFPVAFDYMFFIGGDNLTVYNKFLPKEVGGFSLYHPDYWQNLLYSPCHIAVDGSLIIHDLLNNLYKLQLFYPFAFGNVPRPSYDVCSSFTLNNNNWDVRFILGNLREDESNPEITENDRRVVEETLWEAIENDTFAFGWKQSLISISETNNNTVLSFGAY